MQRNENFSFTSKGQSFSKEKIFILNKEETHVNTETKTVNFLNN